METRRGVGEWPARWTATPLLTRAVIILAVLLLLGSLPIARAAAVARPRHVLQIVAVPAPAAPRVDAVGCPVSARCIVNHVAEPRMQAGLAAVFPKATVTLAEETLDRSGPAYRYRILARLSPTAMVDLIALCQPYGEPVAGRTGGIGHADIDPSGNTEVDTRTYITVVPLAVPGCSLMQTVEYQPRRDTAFDARIDRLTTEVVRGLNG